MYYIPCLSFNVYHTIETHNTNVCEINTKSTFKKININLHDLYAMFLLTLIMCCIDTILLYNDMTHL
jgi:hypothetical protein